jgi:hypothetical protein
VNKNVKFARHKLKRSHLAMLVSANFQSRKCVSISSIAYLSPTADLLKLAHWKKNDKFSAAAVVIALHSMNCINGNSTRQLLSLIYQAGKPT